MSITGKKSEKTGDFVKKIGMGEYLPECFNPSMEKLSELLGKDTEKDPQYLGEKDGIVTLRMSIWLREVKTKMLFNASIFLENREVFSKVEEGSDKKPKNQWINSHGRTAYAEKESDLTDAFKKFPYHKAKVGEADLTSFLDAWMGVDRKEEYSLTPDWSKLMKGSMKEFEDLLKSDLVRTVVQGATVRTKDKDGELKEFQSMYVRKWLPGYVMKHFRINDYTEDKVRALREKYELIKESNKQVPPGGKKVWMKDWEYYILEVSDPEWGLKDAYSFQELKDYDSKEYFLTSNSVSTVSTDDPDY